MARHDDFIMIRAGESRYYVAWAHVVAVTITPLAHEHSGAPGERLQAQIVTADGKIIDAYDDDARRVEHEVRVRATVEEGA